MRKNKRAVVISTTRLAKYATDHQERGDCLDRPGSIRLEVLSYPGNETLPDSKKNCESDGEQAEQNEEPIFESMEKRRDHIQKVYQEAKRRHLEQRRKKTKQIVDSLRKTTKEIVNRKTKVSSKHEPLRVVNKQLLPAPVPTIAKPALFNVNMFKRVSKQCEKQLSSEEYGGEQEDPTENKDRLPFRYRVD